MQKCECTFADHSRGCAKDAVIFCSKCHKASCIPCSRLPLGIPITRNDSRFTHIHCPEGK